MRDTGTVCVCSLPGNGRRPVDTLYITVEDITIYAMSSHTQVSNGSLVLGNVTELDEGNYTCQAVNNGGTAEAHIRIEVLQGFATGQGTWLFSFPIPKSCWWLSKE